MRKSQVNLIVVVLLSLILIGCSSTPRVLEIKAVPIDAVPLNLPDVDVIELDDVQFYVVTEQNVETVFEKLREKNYDPVIFGVTDDGYEMMSVNMAKVLQMVQQQKAVIIAYRTYHAIQQTAVQKNNEAAAKATQLRDGELSTNESLLKRIWPW